MNVIEPQPGPQTSFLSSGADIAIYGGAAGGGKTWALEVEALRHTPKPGFSAVIFRRNATQVRNPGGLWSESMRLYPLLGGRASQARLEWRFPSGASVKFAHLEHEHSVLNWQGAQIPLLCFDELTHFTQSQFFYMLSRNRSVCGVRPYVRATCNPDADSWVASFINWWLHPDTGLPISQRSGVIRWMLRDGNAIRWADTPQAWQHLPNARPKSVTFIASSLFDNRILMQADPGYLANLTALPPVERQRLLDGNWKIRPSAGLYFQRRWCPVVDEAPARLTAAARWWDLAATEKTDANDPDFTVAVKMARGEDGRFYVLHGLSMRKSPYHVKNAILNTARQDGPGVTIGLPQDPGQAGKSQAHDFAAALAGFTLRSRPENGSKITRFGPFSAQCEAGNVAFVRGPWNDEFFNALEAFPNAAHDDHADACAGALSLLTGAAPMRFNPQNIL